MTSPFSSIQEACDKLGEVFISGFSGLELSEETIAFFTQAKMGGVILFAQNYESPGQVAELTNQIQECRGRGLPLWVSVDHEGGKVQRFKKHFTRIPEAAAIGAIGSPKLAFDIAEIMAKELKSVGININFCPVADIQTNSKNPIIGMRAFGTTEDVVSKMVTAVVRGHLVHQVQPCVKHFPGHGDTTTDSHFALPRITASLEILREREFRPFVRAFKSGCAMVMTAHVLNSSLDPKNPATLSSKILREILREELKFSGLIISDDLEMKAIADHFGAKEAPRMALEAGCDLLIYRSEAEARHAYESLIYALESGQLAPAVVLGAVERSRALKQKVLLPYKPVKIAELSQKIGSAEHLALVQKVGGERGQ